MKRSDIDKLVDEQVAYYHGSDDRLPVGRALKAHRNEERAAYSVEKLIDKYRPTKAPSRSQAWFMTQDPCAVEDASGEYHKYTYQVRPVGKVQQANFDWYAKINDKVFKSVVRDRKMPTAKQLATSQNVAYAKNYWKAKPSSNTQTEFLAPAVEIIGKASCKRRRRAKKSRVR